jgi:excinuclease ABC subunit A
MNATDLAEATELTYIEIKGAREHNLKNIDLRIPKKKLVVITGVSGSGKTSLAFDTLFAEGQRRYVESLSAYARQFLGQMEKPKFETLRGLSPTISIEQKSAGKNPRSTVGTITEIHDYLRVLFARVGVQHCHLCGKKVGRGDASTMVEQILAMPHGTALVLLAPVVENRKGEHRELFAELLAEGFARVRIDGVVCDLQNVQTLAKNKKHNIEVVIDRLVCEPGREFKTRLTDSVETALRQGNGHLIAHIQGREDIHMSESRSCCGFAFPQLDPPLFSFNAPQGACPECAGIGSVFSMDPDRIVPDASLSIRDGAVIPWRSYFAGGGELDESWGMEIFNSMEKEWGFDWDTPWKKLSKKQRDIILFGCDKPLKVTWKRKSGSGNRSMNWEGLTHLLMRRYKQTSSEEMKAWYEKFMSSRLCATCDGERLKPEVLAVRIGGKSIAQFSSMNPLEAHRFLDTLNLVGNDAMIAAELIREISNRLTFLVNVGLDYLTLDRRGPTLSGGEAQRLRLASQIGTELTGVLYILDEPSIGLHQRDNTKLLATLQRLRDIGNTVLVVEHDRETIEAADYVVDMGPGAGNLGGQVVAAGTPTEIAVSQTSLTGRYLRGDEQIPLPRSRREAPKSPKQWIEITGAKENNLRLKRVRFPAGRFTCVTGVSGAGKSSLINQILLPAMNRALGNKTDEVGRHDSISGIESFDKVIEIDQKPIGRTPRSNPATYTKLFDHVRDLFAALPEAKVRGFSKGRFSFNVKGGRCEQCQGDGFLRVEMHFLADVYVPCEVCKGKRFNAQTLDVHFKTHSISDVLDLSALEARELFSNQPRIASILDTIIRVGLGYIKLGQPATTLSGGEAQRMKLSRELARRDTGRTLYVLDEPTTGLHFDDIKKLLKVLQSLVDAGNTVVVIEHNLDVIKVADWIVDLGPEGGDRGGLLVAEGTPETVARVPESFTGRYLADVLAH